MYGTLPSTACLDKEIEMTNREVTTDMVAEILEGAAAIITTEASG